MEDCALGDSLESGCAREFGGIRFVLGLQIQIWYGEEGKKYKRKEKKMVCNRV